MRNAGSLIGLVALCGCVAAPLPPQRFPSLEYANRVKGEQGVAAAGFRSAPSVQPAVLGDARARLRPVSDGLNETDLNADQQALLPNVPPGSVTNLGPNVTVHENTMPNVRDYTGPLSVGDPGQSASLWRESRGGNLLFRDYRAFQPMDLITIVVDEASVAKNKADTTVKQESTIAATINKLFGLPPIWDPNNKVFPTAVDGTSSSDYKGEGETNREGSLKARISGMVAEVLPSGVLRIEGEKIIVVNNEDQHMVISGLVRPEDVNSNNEVSSSKVANVRIDYYGRGAVGDAQTGGWLSNLLRRFWPL